MRTIHFSHNFDSSIKTVGAKFFYSKKIVGEPQFWAVCDVRVGGGLWA